MNDFKLDDHLTRTAKTFPSCTALVSGDERWSWAELERTVDQIAAAWLALGVARGDRVAVLAPNRPEVLLCYLAASRIGAIFTPLSPLYTPPELGRLLALARPSLLVAPLELGGRGLEAWRELLDPALPAGCTVIAMDEGWPASVPAGVLAWSQVAASGAAAGAVALAERRREVTPDDGLLIVFTSGSTGRPKAALLSHRNVLSNITVEIRQLGITADDRILLHLPLNHVGGATELAVPAVMTGATLVLMERFHPAQALELVARERISLLGQVPTMFVLELGLSDFASYDLSSLRTLAVAGAACPRDVFERMSAMAPQVVTGYGLTEAAGFVTYTEAGDDLSTLAGTVGRAVPEVELRIVDALARPLPVGEVGEVALRGACVMRGYFEDPAASAEVLTEDGWLLTGDLGRLDARGYLTLVDRKKEMFISGGYNVYPREIEEHLLRHPRVALAACLGRIDGVMGEIGVAWVVPKPGWELSSEEILGHCRAGLAEYKIPRRVEVCAELPLTSLGKVDKPALRRCLEVEP